MDFTMRLVAEIHFTKGYLDTVGCVSDTSIVQTDFGTFFAGNDGFYWTDSFKVIKVSNEFNERYRALVNNNKRIYGAYDEENSRIYWSTQREAVSADVDSCFVLDLRFGIRPDSCFTTLSGGDNFAPTAMVFFQKEWIRADYRGYIFKHNKNLLTDKVYRDFSCSKLMARNYYFYGITNPAHLILELPS